MLFWTLQTIIISVILIFLVHHLLIFFKSTLTVPKIKDLLNSPLKNYDDIINSINNSGLMNNSGLIDNSSLMNNSSLIDNSSLMNNNNSLIDNSGLMDNSAVMNNSGLMNNIGLIDNNNQNNVNNMKNDLKFFLKNKLNK